MIREMIETDVIHSSHLYDHAAGTYIAEFADNDKELVLWVQDPWGLE